MASMADNRATMISDAMNIALLSYVVAWGEILLVL